MAADDRPPDRHADATGDDGAGRRTPKHLARCIAIAGAFVARVAYDCCGSAMNAWSGPLVISTTPAACAASPWAHQHSEAAADPHRWLQPGLLMRQLIGVGSPRGLQGRLTDPRKP